jgi:hypothetical protein
MPDYLGIFQQQAPKYDVLVSREDHEGRLVPAVRSTAPLELKANHRAGRWNGKGDAPAGASRLRIVGAGLPRTDRPISSSPLGASAVLRSTAERHCGITDYKFATISEATDLTTFFFGKDPLAALVVVPDGVLPECTGTWWRNALGGSEG